ncbi:DUF2161 family putative PD-(D/E)XK-type phosphodiesterase [Acidaminobacter hydrogenoformans]|uniref:Uncharacterized protein n=1 Tax=Acidaminobacter hydrogenoformans DSM 2784 TaxID=1120920 RepID=A0A1G5RXJ9_9FIRM|nr:DUF2161 family putative PD-(D/E)XK-type phosphodiesterase [Acidaminobacter hydrogenoformans]SCZ78865.1 hypothetical protein SAMN03080599_01480 [Acidaminobacter hydrogenoformans DSM 2784]
MDKIQYERELYEPLKQYLEVQGFDVRSEVRSCDIVAKKNDLIYIIEMKRHLSFDLLAQAVERLSYADAVYVSIPKPNNFKQDKIWKSKLKVLKQLGLGLLLVSKTGSSYLVEEALIPESLKAVRTSSKKRVALEKEFNNRSMDLNIAGSSGVPLVTAYREAALYIAFLIREHGALDTKALKGLGAHPKKTTSILNANYYGWFEKAENKVYCLTEAGEESLTAYKPLVDAFKALNFSDD